MQREILFNIVFQQFLPLNAMKIIFTLRLKEMYTE